MVPRVFSFSNKAAENEKTLGTSLGVTSSLDARVLTKSLPLITARIQKSDWVRVWGTGDIVMNILTAASSIAPTTVTRLRNGHNGPGKR